MCIAPRFNSGYKRGVFVICLSAAHQYLEPQYMLKQAGRMIELFGLGWSTRKLADVAAFIEDGFDDLVAMEPETRPDPVVIGEGEAWMGSDKMVFDVTDRMMEAST